MEILKEDMKTVINKYTDNTILLSDIYELLKRKIKIKFAMATTRGVQLGRKWIIQETLRKQQKKMEKNYVVSTSLSGYESLDACERKIILFACNDQSFLISEEELKTVISILLTNLNNILAYDYDLVLFEYYSYFENNQKLSKYVSNCLYFCLGGYFYGEQYNIDTKKQIYKKIYKRFYKEGVNKKTIQQETSCFFNRACKYFVIMSVIGLGNLFNRELSKDKIIKLTAKGLDRVADYFSHRKINDHYFITVYESLGVKSELYRYFTNAIEQLVNMRKTTDNTKKDKKKNFKDKCNIDEEIPLSSNISSNTISEETKTTKICESIFVNETPNEIQEITENVNKTSENEKENVDKCKESKNKNIVQLKKEANTAETKGIIKKSSEYVPTEFLNFFNMPMINGSKKILKSATVLTKEKGKKKQKGGSDKISTKKKTIIKLKLNKKF